MHLSSDTFLHCCLYFHVTLGERLIGYPVVVHFEIIFKLVHGLCCYGSICNTEREMLASACTCSAAGYDCTTSLYIYVISYCLTGFSRITLVWMRSYKREHLELLGQSGCPLFPAIDSS